MTPVYALVDCNNFYASCERVFQPSLWKRPVAILSNNDGNIVARSDELKALGIPFGAPYFQWADFLKKHDVAVFSSNYTLYGDMSRRVMDILSTFTPDLEIYSIDEAFLVLEGTPEEITALARDIRRCIAQWTGIPVSIGIAVTKTLAKLANKIAKKNSDCGGVFNFAQCSNMDACLDQIGVGDIWGVGRQYSKMLQRHGIYTVRDLVQAPDSWVKKKMTIVGLRMVMELRGISCIPLEKLPAAKKEIVSSRSFGKPVDDMQGLKEALVSYVSRAAEKLRAQESLASYVCVFVTTNRFKKNEPQYSNGMTLKLPVASAYTPALIYYAVKILEKIYRNGYRYKKVGVMLAGLVPAGEAQLDLFWHFKDTEKSRKLMETVDMLNSTMGRGTVHCAAEGIKKSWRMRRHFLSQRYTTHWKELPVVRAGVTNCIC